ncbi:MAG TPA: M15 family metallopeptidase [Dissulfurispiraceae bacterium]|nr:M15 family metallopeptidase [Dissulfurispiraceae bacterium]
MASRKIEDLAPDFQPTIIMFEDHLAREGLSHFKRCCTYRSQAEQSALWAQGRKSLRDVNDIRKATGMAPITQKQNKKVTWTLSSDHTKRIAVDYYIEQDGKYCDDLKVDVNKNAIADWLEFGAIAERCGLDWGGSWVKKDYPHVGKKRQGG